MSFFRNVNVEKILIGYPITDFFADFIERKYVEDVWVPLDPGPDFITEEVPFGSLHFTITEVKSFFYWIWMLRRALASIVCQYDF
jgi:hypothetical protein